MGSHIIPQVTADMNTTSAQQASNSNNHHHQGSTVFAVPPNSLGIPTAAYKRRMKETDLPGRPTGTLISARLVFNLLYRESISDDVSSSENYPVYPQMANSIKDLIRSYLYQRLSLQRGKRTFTSVKIEYASQLLTLKRKLEEKFPVLQAAQNHWIATEFIKQSMQRDKKATVEAEEKNMKTSSGPQGQESAAAPTAAPTVATTADPFQQAKLCEGSCQNKQLERAQHRNQHRKNVVRGGVNQDRRDVRRHILENVACPPEPIQEHNVSEDHGEQERGRNDEQAEVDELSVGGSEDSGSFESEQSEGEPEKGQRTRIGIKKPKNAALHTGGNSTPRSISRLEKDDTEDSIGSDDIFPVPVSKGSRVVKSQRKRNGLRNTIKKALKKAKQHGFRAPRPRKSLDN